MKKTQLTKEEQQEVDYTLNHWDHFEDYCGGCDNFETDACPFKGRVDDRTEYATLKCTKFWD